MELEEMIADAKAEEQVAREQEKAEREQAFKKEFREKLKGALSKETAQVTIDLNEYIMLRQKETDLDRILGAIVDSVGLSYNNEHLRIEDDDIVVSALRALYPEAYTKLLAAELEELEKKRA